MVVEEMEMVTGEVDCTAMDSRCDTVSAPLLSLSPLEPNYEWS